MGSLEPIQLSTQVPEEIGICGDARASTPAKAEHVANLARTYSVHAPYPHQLATAGNFAMPFSPCQISIVQLSEFCVYQVMKMADPVGLFLIKLSLLGGAVPKVPRRSKVHPHPLRPKQVTNSHFSLTIHRTNTGETRQWS